jgi:hypothetical protein
VQRFVIGQQVPVSHLGMTDGMKRLRLSGKERNMRAGVTNMQRLAAADSSCFLIRPSLTLCEETLAFRRRLTELFRTPASGLDSLTNTQL